MKKMNYTFSVPDNKRVRMIVSTDCKNEADDQFALAHHLMTPMFIMKGIVPCHFSMFSRDYGDGHTAQASMDEVNKVLDLLDLQGICPVCKGSEFPMKDEQTPAISEGAKLIVEEAMKDDPHPAGGEEFNLRQDIAAANVVMKSGMKVWQVPSTVYKKVTVSLTELQLNVQPCGEIGNYLYEMVEAPEISYEDMSFTGKNRKIRVYHDPNAELTLRDFFAKLKLNYGM